MNHTAIPIPDRMKHLPLDRRGYPIPYIVYHDEHGQPHFTINDMAKRLVILKDDLCALCGSKLYRGRWYVGGPAAALHPQGAYIDPPLHAECARYALQVCPFLAARHYGKRIETRTLDDDHAGVIIKDENMETKRPPLFVAVMSTGHTLVGPEMQPYLHPRRPYMGIEYWQHGRKLDTATGRKLAQDYMREYDAEQQS